MPELSPKQIKKQELYRDARFTDQYDDIWQSVGKCVFCDMRDKYIFFEENGVVMTISLYAYIDGHFLIVPRRHIRSAKELNDLEWSTIRKFTYIAKKLFKDVHGIKGMQLVQKDGSAAQSTVEHVHFHCVPFDSPDLLTWNYRKLKYTPLQNVTLYKNARKKIIAADQKFQKKYSDTTSIAVVCDVIIVNGDNQILFQERVTSAKLKPDYITIPGGHVEDFTQSLEQELVREVKEEIGYDLNPNKLRLVSSQIDQVKRNHDEAHLRTKYTTTNKFIRNTYVIRDFPVDVALVVGDDARELIWINVADVENHARISPTTREIIQKELLS